MADLTWAYVGVENEDRLAAIDALSNRVIATIPVGQAAQALAYAPNAVPQGNGTLGLQPLGLAGESAHRTLVSPADAKVAGKKRPTSVSLFDQGLLQVLQASVTGLQPKQSYVLALSSRPDGNGAIEPLATFTTNPAGPAVVNAIGPIRQVVRGEADVQRRYLVITLGTATQPGAPVQIQAADDRLPARPSR